MRGRAVTATKFGVRHSEAGLLMDSRPELIQTGKIRAWGIPEATEDYLRRAHAVCSVAENGH